MPSLKKEKCTMKGIVSIVFLFICLNIFSQGIRFDPDRGSVGVQTPHEWKVYGHIESVLFSYPFAPQIRVSAFDMQMGYNWLNGERAAFRTGANLTLWHVIPNEDREYNTYWTIVPFAVTVYPFNRAYLGVDLYTELDLYDATFDTGMTVVVRF